MERFYVTPFTAQRAAAEFIAWAQKEYKANPLVEIKMAGTSYSRGSVIDTAYLNNVWNAGVGKRGAEIYGDINNPSAVTGYTSYWVAPQSVNLGIHLMYDRVAGPINSAGSAGVVAPPDPNLRILHIVANEEHRMEFASESLYSLNKTLAPRFNEFGYAAAHANIGGNSRNRGISLYTLDMGMQWFGSYGLNLGTLPPEFQIGNAPLLIRVDSQKPRPQRHKCAAALSKRKCITPKFPEFFN
ncbi:hypothetical protein [Anabaena sp. PCC 7938]|uniref:hypothetical protein n=1 Tax=Anabaena sp. PCC 7938 TaxID=1296340 RepID=UPI0002FA09C7|nr:hypothetical protein [Anabaena sp. CCAP 1446/1C]